MELSLRDPVPCAAGKTWHVSLGLASFLLGTWLRSLTPPTESHQSPLRYQSHPLRDAEITGDSGASTMETRVCQLSICSCISGVLLKLQTQLRKSGVGPEILHF